MLSIKDGKVNKTNNVPIHRASSLLRDTGGKKKKRKFNEV